MSRRSGFLIMEKRCSECLYTPQRIVSNKRFREIVKHCDDVDGWFVCHKAQAAGWPDVMCYGDHMVRPYSRPHRLAEALGLQPKFIKEEELASDGKGLHGAFRSLGRWARLRYRRRKHTRASNAT